MLKLPKCVPIALQAKKKKNLFQVITVRSVALPFYNTSLSHEHGEQKLNSFGLLPKSSFVGNI